MQTTASNPCTNDPQTGYITEERHIQTLAPTAFRRWLDDALAWLDRYWDDPELRSGFWRSGW